ncbi:radical SAM protein [Sorangium sp. So ce131]|uniref:radical SAM protein n=1 Tax=Sorangium sp. So ce131 TaxID=3133282 RepID=UPI003F5E3EE7
MATDRLIHETTSLCPACKIAVGARVVATPSGEVWMRKACPEHGPRDVRISTSAAWYEATRAAVPIASPPAAPRRPIEHGCPFDCGPCEGHAQRVRMPVVTITSACDLDCPMCYVHNKNDGAFFMSKAEFGDVLRHLVAGSGGDLDLINLTGGEPTLHPELPELVAMCRDAGIHRVSICSHGFGLLRNDALLRRLAELGARVALSFDTFEDATDKALNGVRSVDKKLACLERLDAAGVDTTLIPVMTRGHNDHEIGRIIDLGLRLGCVRHLEVHTMTFTGQSGAGFDRGGRISTIEVLERIAETTSGLLSPEDFIPSPCAHPLCYQIAYLLMDPGGGPPIPFTRFMSREALYGCLGDHLYLEPSARLERAMQDAIDALWARGGDERALGLLNGLLRALFPARKPLRREEALRISERAVKAVYVHSHMDEETFDVERAYQCCDSNCYADGRTVPVCNYNVLYREKEPRFMSAPRTWSDRSGGRRALPLLAPSPRREAT